MFNAVQPDAPPGHGPERSDMTAADLSGCGGWFGGKEQTRLEGKRIDVLRGGSNLKKDSRISDLDVLLPRPKINEDWPQAGGYPNHAMHHLAASGPLAKRWNADIGEGTNEEAQLLAQPVVAGNRVYTVDAKAEVSAFDTRSGNRLWQVDRPHAGTGQRRRRRGRGGGHPLGPPR